MSNILTRIEEIIVVIVLVVMSSITFGNVISRNVFNMSMAFTEEITVNLFILLTFVGAAIGVRKRAHLGFTLLMEKISGVPKKFLILATGSASFFIFLIITYYGIEMALFQKEVNSSTPALNWPQWIFSLGIPLGGLLCLIRTTEVTIEQLKES